MANDGKKATTKSKVFEFSAEKPEPRTLNSLGLQLLFFVFGFP